ncbi:V-type ATP synthase subunit I domain-containing protein [Staphylococcus haemolyticus]|uniref:hypothetical protein n=1 Tax=Staphylococcus haemolyticus TaxID=1283 RepID=UPI00115CB1C4|nr:hypothetical protein [Staphylococcus haemolyticus]TRL65369.1 hypothetical protein FNL07_12110 [Staphylococcus haemolyticus]
MSIESNVNKIKERSENQIWSDKIDEFNEGLEKVKEEYDDRFTETARNEAIKEYKETKNKEIEEELKAYDERSNELVSITLEQIDNELVEDEMNLHPQTDLDFKKHDYYVSQVMNELATSFNGQDMSTEVLERLIKQGYNNNLYALAILSNKKEVLDRIRSNEVVRQDIKNHIETTVKYMFDDLKNNIMPERYKRNKELKEELKKYSHSTKFTMYNIIVNNPNKEGAKNGKTWAHASL